MEDQYTLIIQDGNVVLIRDEAPSPAAAGFFLVFLLTLGLCLNAALLVGLCAWPPQRGATFARLLLLQLSCACALDCALDMTSSVALLLLLHFGVTAGGEGRAAAFCRANAALSQYVVMVEGVVVAALAVERALALRELRCDGKITERTRMWGLFLVVWGYPAVLVLPTGVTSSMVAVRPIVDRYSCGMVARPTDVTLYPGLLSVLGGALPWAVAVVAVASMACHVARLHRRRRRLEEAALQRGSQRAVPAAVQLSWEESRLHLLAAVLAVLFLLLVSPNVGIASLPPARRPPRRAMDPVSTGSYDSAFLWTRYLFPSAAAVAALALVKEARKRCEAVLCRRASGNAVAQLDEALSVAGPPPARYARAAHYRTPVLFATSEGLHLRIVRDGRGRHQPPATAEPGFACEFCDVAIEMSSAPPPAGGKNNPPARRRGLAAPLFGPEPVAEGDLRVSDSLTSADDDTARVSDSAEVRRARHARGKVVRFAQTVSEIPSAGVGGAAEPGDWEPYEDFGADRYRQPPRLLSRLS